MMRGALGSASLAACALGLAHGAISDPPLEPEKAFRLSAKVVPAKAPGAAQQIDLRFDIEKGHYLSRERFKAEAAGLAAGALIVPDGKEKSDLFVGRSRILRGSATLRLPLTRPAAPGSYVVRITAQGCAEDRFCYAPFTQSRNVAIP